MQEYYIWSSLCWNHGLFPFPVLTRTDNQQILHIFIFYYTLLLFALICQSFNWSSCAVHFLAIFLVLEKLSICHISTQKVSNCDNWRKLKKRAEILFWQRHPHKTVFVIIISSVRSSNNHPDLLLTQHHPTHFFRSHRSSPLDLHFLSHYSYI